jgi:uncharacterized protein with FMN-binding domain
VKNHQEHIERTKISMRKLVVAILIVGVFILYSFVDHSSSAALPPTSSNDSSSSTSAPSPNAASSPSPGATSTTGSGSGAFKNGSYTGSAADAVYGNVQVKAVIQQGKITSVQFLQYPNTHSYSVYVNSNADPVLSSEAIQAQSANVNIVSGATDTSQAFIQSLSSALSQAK